MWSKETYSNCTSSTKCVVSQTLPKSGLYRDVILLQEDVTHQHTWKRARVENLIFGCDEKVRTSVLRTNGRTSLNLYRWLSPFRLTKVRKMLHALNSTRSLK
ncbi:hypothetical protein TNCV_3934491 [Trichonephila clavipes]|nr:hypothetical protein TNCV_3934491 [Trichonephila clavipes]